MQSKERMFEFYVTWVAFVTLFCYMERYALPGCEHLYRKIASTIALITACLIVADYLNGTLF